MEIYPPIHISISIHLLVLYMQTVHMKWLNITIQHLLDSLQKVTHFTVHRHFYVS